MKKFKKIFAALAASALVAAMSFTSMAATATPIKAEFKGAENASITVNVPQVEDGGTANNTYYVYKVFDASHNGKEGSNNISYKLRPNHSVQPDGFKLDNAGNVSTDKTTLDATDVENIRTYVGAEDPDNSKDLVAKITTVAGDDHFTLSGLKYGYYYIDTTTGALVTVDSTTPNITVIDKNDFPTLDKKISSVGKGSVTDDGTNALAQLGTTVSYTSTISVGHGVVKYVFHDKMDAGLELIKDSIKIDGKSLGSSDSYESKKVTANTIEITFKDNYVEGKEKIIITYDAKVKAGDLTEGKSAKNTAYLSYGDDESAENRTSNKVTNVYNAKLTVTKYEPSTENADGKVGLKDAGFVITNKEGKYYLVDANGEVSWVSNESNATEKFSDKDGKVDSFVGLADGEYTLIEKTVPASYNKAEDVKFTVSVGTYTNDNLEQKAEVINRKGIKLPSTGGMGTTVFAIVGLLVMAGAAVTLIVKKRA